MIGDHQDFSDDTLHIFYQVCAARNVFFFEASRHAVGPPKSPKLELCHMDKTNLIIR